MDYKIGDVVRICDDLIIGGYYGRAMIKLTYDMAQSRGTVGEITDVSEEEDAVKVNGWWWSTTMIDAAEAEQLEQLTQIIGAFSGYDPGKRLEEQLARHLFENGVRVQKEGDA